VPQLSLVRTVGLLFAALCALVVFASGLFMLFSPKKWFDLPPYIGFHGTLRRDRLLTFSGRLGIRVLGFVYVSALLSITISLLPIRSDYILFSGTTISPSIGYGTSLATCIAVGGFGILLLLKSRWWIETYVQPLTRHLEGHESVLVIVARILSVLLIVPAACLGWECLTLLLHR
jgi:hypothetical protein